MRALLLGVLFLLAGPSLAAAQETDGAARAEALIEEGVALRRGGDDVAALARFEEAYALDPSPRAAAQVGLAQQALGRWVEADARLREALSATDDPFVQEYREALASSHAAVLEQVGQLHVLGGVEGATVRFGGRTVATLPMEGPATVVIGTSPLEVSAEGHRDVQMELTVRAGELTRQMVELEPVAPPTPVTPAAAPASAAPSADAPEPAPADEGSSVLEAWWLWAIVGAVVVGAVVVGVFVGTQGEADPLEGTLGTSAALVRF